MGGGITGNFDYVGWDAQYNKPYYRTKACLRFAIHDLDSRNSEKYLNEFSRFCQYGLQEQRFQKKIQYLFANKKRLNLNGMFYSILKIMVILHFVTRQQLELVFG